MIHTVKGFSVVNKAGVVDVFLGFPNGSTGKESVCNAGDTGDAGLIPGWGRSPREGNDNPFQYSCLETCQRNLVGHSSWGQKSWTTEQLNSNNKEYDPSDNLSGSYETVLKR